MSVAILPPTTDQVPNDGVAVGGTGTNVSAVDEFNADDDTSYLKYSTPGRDQFGYSLSALKSGIPAQNIVDSVSLLWRAKPQTAAGDFTHRGRIIIDGVTENSLTKTQAAGGGYVTQDLSLTVHPGHGGPLMRRHFIDGTFRTEFEMLGAPGGIPSPRFTWMRLTVTSTLQTKLKAIKSYLAETVGDITVPWKSDTIRNAGSYGTLMRAWYDVVNFPAAYLALGSETKRRWPTQSKEGKARFLVPCVVKDISGPLERFLDLYGLIETAIEADPSLDGLAIDCFVAGHSALTTSKTIAGGVHVADIFVDVTYRHAKGAP